MSKKFSELEDEVLFCKYIYNGCSEKQAIKKLDMLNEKVVVSYFGERE